MSHRVVCYIWAVVWYMAAHACNGVDYAAASFVDIILNLFPHSHSLCGGRRSHWEQHATFVRRFHRRIYCQQTRIKYVRQKLNRTGHPNGRMQMRESAPVPNALTTLQCSGFKFGGSELEDSAAISAFVVYVSWTYATTKRSALFLSLVNIRFLAICIIATFRTTFNVVNIHMYSVLYADVWRRPISKYHN